MSSSKHERLAALRRYLRDATPERLERYGARNYELEEWAQNQGHWLADFFRQRVAPQPATLHEILVREGMLHWLGSSGRALIISSGSGRVLHTNATADKRLEGPALSMKESYLVAAGDSATEAWRAYLAAPMRQTGIDGYTLRSGVGGPALRVTRRALPFHDPAESAQSLFLLELFDDAQPAVDEMLLQDWFGLSAAEAALAAAFAAGESLQDYAGHHNLSINTVRTQFQRIKSKTGGVDQANVARILLQASQS